MQPATASSLRPRVPRVTLITGASSGLGAALASRFAVDGDSVALVARRAENLEAVAEEIRRAGGTALPIPCDVRDREAVHAAIRQCEAALGPIDLLVANAGVGDLTPAVAFDAAELERVMQTNVMGAAYCFEAVVPGMVQRASGQLVGISSLASYNGLPGYAFYSASKAALSNLLEGMRIELHSHGIVVTTVCPGFFRTARTRKYGKRTPYLMELDEATQHVYSAIRAHAAEYAFPWPLAQLARYGRFLPKALTDRLLDVIVS